MSARLPPAVVVWIFLALACGAVIAGTRFTSDMSAFLPRSPSPAQQILVDQVQTGAASRLLLLAIEGAPTPTLATVSKEFATRLREDKADFNAVDNSNTSMASAPERDVFWRYRYVLSPAMAPARFTAAGLHQALEQDLRLLGSDMGSLVEQTLPHDPTGEILTILGGLANQKHPVSREGVWFAADGSRALLIARTRQAGFDIAAEEKVLATIESTFAAVKATAPGTDAVRLLLSGPGVFAVHTKDEMKQDISRLTLIATILVSAILLFTYRSPRILVLAIVPVASGALAGIAAVSLGFGFVHGITLGFGVTLIGEAVDYAIYLFTQTAPGTPADATLPRIWPMLQLGVLVSICGFSAMLFSSFTGFAQLGLFSITGLLVAVAVTRWVLPRLLARNFATAKSTIFAPILLTIVARARVLRLPLALALAGSVALLALHKGSFWEDDLNTLSPIPASDQKLDQMLRADVGAPDVRYLVISPAADEQGALSNSEAIAAILDQLKSEGLVAGYDAPTQYLPSIAAQRARLDALPSPEQLRGRLDTALQDTPFTPNLFDPFLADAASAKSQSPLDRATFEGTSAALRLDSLLVNRGGVWTPLISLTGVTDAPRVAARIAAAGVAGASFVDLKSESDRLLSVYQHEAVMLAVIGCLVILGLLAVSLRSARRLALVALPLAGAVLLTFAILTAGGHRLSIFNLVGLLLTVAVGSNYCIFFERQDWRDSQAERMVASLVLANICTIIGFGTLSFARLPVLHDIGTTVAIGTVLSLVLAAIVTGRAERHRR
jgi:predicted exporter